MEYIDHHHNPIVLGLHMLDHHNLPHLLHQHSHYIHHTAMKLVDNYHNYHRKHIQIHLLGIRSQHSLSLIHI